MSISSARIRAVISKELTEFRRSRNIVATMGIIPVIVLVAPTFGILGLHPSAPGPSLDQGVGFVLAYLLLIPVLVPSTLAAYSVVGERDQGTLEPVLTTPVRREELLIGKAAASFMPAVGVAYLALSVFLAIVRAGASPLVATAVWHSPELVAEVVFIPLLVGWGVWIGVAISSRASDIRVAQQLSILASLPPLALILLMSFHVINSTLLLGASLAGALLVIDCAAYLLVSKLFDIERLVTGTKPGPAITGTPQSGSSSGE